MDAPTTASCSDLLGVGMNGRLVVVGVQQVRDAAQRGKLKLAVIAPDASHNSLDKVVPMLRAKHIRDDRRTLGDRAGRRGRRESTAAVGVVDPQLARGIRAIVESAPPEGHAADSIRAR